MGISKDKLDLVLFLQDIRVVSIVGGQSIEEQGFKLRQVGNSLPVGCFITWHG